MKITKMIIVTLLLLSTNLFAQTKTSQEHLKGLTKASSAEIAKKQITLDGETIPVYNIEGKRIRGEEMMTAMMSGKYTPDFYVDKDKEIKAITLRLATAEEQIKALTEKVRMSENSESVGKEAPNFTVTDIKGTTYTLSELKGKTVVLNFWFIRCKPCVKEIPELNELVEAYKDNENVVFLGLATDSKSKLETFLSTKKFNYNIVPTSMDVARAYNVFGYPTHIVIDTKGIIQFETSGLSPSTIHNLEAAIKKSL